MFLNDIASSFLSDFPKIIHRGVAKFFQFRAACVTILLASRKWDQTQPGRRRWKCGSGNAGVNKVWKAVRIQ